MVVNGKHHAPIERAKNGTFVAGHRGGPGRPVGSRNRLAESFLADLQKQWAKSGKKALERTATDDPVAFTKIVASLMPREMLASVINVNANVDARLVADVHDFKAAYEAWGRAIGVKGLPLIEAEAIEGEDLVRHARVGRASLLPQREFPRPAHSGQLCIAQVVIPIIRSPHLKCEYSGLPRVPPVAWLQLCGTGIVGIGGAPVDPLLGQLTGLEDCLRFDQSACARILATVFAISTNWRSQLKRRAGGGCFVA
jgi:hypothetical protein